MAQEDSRNKTSNLPPELGAAKTGADMVTQQVGKKVGEKVVAQAAKTGLGRAVAAASAKIAAVVAGSVVPVIGNALMFLATTFGGKYINKGLQLAGAAVIGAATLLVGTAAFILTGIIGFFGAVVAAVFVTAFIALAIVGVMVPLILFIINSGGHIIPGTVGDFPPIGAGPNWESNCPSGWPMQRFVMTQGPFTPDGWTHYGLEAVDLTFYGVVTPSETVVATHPGTVRWAGVDSYGGLFVDLIGTCSGIPFRSRHVHFSSISSAIYNAATDTVYRIPVINGTVLGVVGDTGYANTVHDHYEFRPADSGGADRFVNSPIRMEAPFVPQTPPRGCLGAACGISQP